MAEQGATFGFKGEKNPKLLLTKVLNYPSTNWLLRVALNSGVLRGKYDYAYLPIFMFVQCR